MSPPSFWDNPPDPAGQRLREEAEAAGLDEKTLMARGGISRQQLATMLHGSFDNVNGAVLKRLANVGINIQYVMTGFAIPLPREEAVLIDNYRNSSADSQSAIRKIGSALAEQDEDLMLRPVMRG